MSEQRHSASGPDGETAPAPRKRKPRLTAVAKVTRDAAIMAALHASEDVKVVAARYSITPRQVQRIYAEFKMRRSTLDARPMQIIERAIATYEQQMEVALALAAATADEQPNIAIAAVKTHTTLLERYLQLLSDVGKLPDNLEVFRMESEMLRIGQTMVDKLHELEQGLITASELRDFWEGLLGLLGPREEMLELGRGDASEDV